MDFFLLHNFMDRRFVLTVNLNNLRYEIFFLQVKNFHLKEHFMASLDMCEWPAALLLSFGVMIK